MTAYRTETVDTPAGTYTVELHSDEDSENPLTSWDHEGMAFYVSSVDYSRTHAMVDTMDDADRAGDVLRQLVSEYGQDEITRRYSKWATITDNPWTLFTGSDSASQSDFYRWYVLVDVALVYLASDGNHYPSLPHPQSAARATMSDYRTWAAGEVSGYVTLSPDGAEVDSCWSFYDDDEALAEGKSSAEYDSAQRVDQAARAGAGIIGLI